MAVDTKYHQQALLLNSGDRVFLYTDGVVETPDQAGAQFGQDRLAATLAEFGSAPLAELKASVLQRVRDHAGGRLTHDDVTLLAIEVRWIATRHPVLSPYMQRNAAYHWILDTQKSVTYHARSSE